MTSIIIVSFNTKDKLQACLSCLDTSKYEVIVVDNASKDDSVAMVQTEFPAVKLIESKTNLGFGPANNIGLDQALGELVLFLNSDAYASPGSVEKLTEVFADQSIVAAGGKLLNLDGSLQESVAEELTLLNVLLEQLYLERLARLFGAGYWRTTRLPQDKVSEVNQVMGACLMMRKSCGERFDERFFLYCEDTEICVRLKKHGKIVYVPQAEFTHELGSSSSNNRWLAVARYNLGKELYFRIQKGPLSANICWLINRFGAFLRVLAGMVIWRRGEPLKSHTFWRVLFANEREINPLFRKPR